MIDFPFDVFVRTTLGIGIVYYYQSDYLIHSEESHYFVVLAHSDSTFHVVCATSQIEKRKEFVRIRRLPAQTLVEVAPTPENGLKKQSLFDCNFLYEETLLSLKRKHDRKPMQVRGCMSDATVQLLINGVTISPLVTKEKKLLFQ